MKAFLYATTIASVLFFFAACEENPPFTIDFGDGNGNPIDTLTNDTTIQTICADTTFIATPSSPQQKVVVMEEFTGVRCVNCPAGHAKAQELMDLYPGRFLVATIHAGFLTDPYTQSHENYVINDGESLFNQPGFSEGAVPAAAIDRVLFSGQSAVALLGVNTWAGRVATQLAKTTPVNIYLHQEYNPANRQLEVCVQMRYTEAVTDENRLHLYLLESNIVNSQLIPISGGEQVKDDYVHRHVLRDMITPLEGVELTDETTAGRVIVKHFTYTLPANFNPENCSILTFVQEKTTDSILQGAEAELGE